MLDLTEKDGQPEIKVSDKYEKDVVQVLTKYKSVLNQGKLLQLSFTTLSEYLWLLRSASQALAPLGNRIILYMAAAVSDFYIPSNEMVIITQEKPTLCRNKIFKNNF